MTQIDIHNGPGLGEMIHNGPFFKCFFGTTFTVSKKGSQEPIDRKDGWEKEPLRVTGMLVGIIYDKGDIRNQEPGKKPGESPSDPGRLSLILHHRGIRWDNHYLVFKYDLRTRKGDGLHLSEDEYFTNLGLMRPKFRLPNWADRLNPVTCTLLSPQSFSGEWQM